MSLSPAMATGCTGSQPQLPARWVRLFLYIFVASIPFEGAWIAGGAADPLFSISRITGVALFVVSLLSLRTSETAIPHAAFCYLAYIAAVLLAFMMNGAEHAPDVAEQLFMLLQMQVLLCLTYNHCRSRQLFDRALTVIGASITVLAAMQLAGYVAVQDSAGNRTSAFQEDPNTVGATFAIGLIILGWKLIHARGWVSRVALAICMPILALALTQTGSRGALLALTVALMSIIVLQPWMLRRPSSLLAVGALVIVVLLAVTHTDVMATRLEQFFGSGDTSYRSQIWSNAITMFTEKPLAGWGAWRNYEELGGRTGQGFVDTHNVYLLVLTQAGLIGALPYLAGMWLSVRGAFQARRDQVYGIMVPLLVCVLVVNLDLSWHNRKLHWIVMALALAAGTSGSRNVYMRGARIAIPQEQAV